LHKTLLATVAKPRVFTDLKTNYLYSFELLSPSRHKITAVDFNISYSHSFNSNGDSKTLSGVLDAETTTSLSKVCSSSRVTLSF
jgi:hypothetical protein